MITYVLKAKKVIKKIVSINKKNIEKQQQKVIQIMTKEID